MAGGSLAEDGGSQEELAVWVEHALIDYLRRLEEQRLRDCEADRLGRFEVDDEFKLRRLLHWQISRRGAFQNLVHVDSRAPKQVNIVHPIGHQTALINKLLLEINGRHSILVSKLDDPLSFGEKGANGSRHNRAYLFLLCGLKGALQAFGVERGLDLLQF